LQESGKENSMRFFKSKLSYTVLISLIAQLLITGSTLSVENALEDKQITGVIEAELWIDETVSSHLIDVKTEDGIVTLSGSVDNILEKDRATQIARSVKGVFGVIDRIEVIGPGLSDSKIHRDILAALMYDPATESFEVDVEVKDGIVTLTGQVQSYAEKALCSTVVKGVKGVKVVKNNIEVRYETGRSDREIKADIEQRLEFDVWVNSPIDVEVSDGKVTLKGVVGSASEKNVAEADAWVAGVESVNADGLKIQWWARGHEWKREIYANLTDEWIKGAVETSLSRNPRTRMLPINVDVSKKVVTLTGVVNNLKAKRVAEEIAEDIAGVWRIKNHIRVRARRQLSDPGIADSIRDALSRDPYVSRHGIRVSVYNGKVYLTGSVDSYHEKDRAEDVASRVIGVAAIENNLDVDYEYDPYSKNDWEIREDIEDNLYWSPFVDSDDIDVSVEDGVATLTGSVSTLFEHKAAVKNAKDGGARNVVSELYIEYRP
jgi:osmotically-inducible protein OsmY